MGAANEDVEVEGIEVTGHKQLSGKRVACLATDGFEQAELLDPKAKLEEAGAVVHVISGHGGVLHGWREKDSGDDVNVDRTLDAVSPDEYDALLLPGGAINADHLRIDPKAVAFARAFVEARKPIAAICHAPWLLIEAGGVEGRAMTSYPSLHTDLSNAGAKWRDETVVVDRGWVTSRRPADLPAFDEKMLEVFARAKPSRARKARRS
ncbi:MAG: type 1 glutamine amidotransferase domain-containing protein [Myxococcaceae bacterium]